MKKLLTLLIVLVLSCISVSSYGEAPTNSDLNAMDDETLVQMAENINEILLNRNVAHGITINQGTYIGGRDFPIGSYDIYVPDDAEDDYVEIDAYTSACLQMIAETGTYPYPDLAHDVRAKKGNPYHIYLQKGDKLIVKNRAILSLVKPLFGLETSDTDNVLIPGWDNASTEVLQSALLSINNEIQSRLHFGTATESTPASEEAEPVSIALPTLTTVIEWDKYLSLKAPEGSETYRNDDTGFNVFLHGAYSSAILMFYLDDDGYYSDMSICERFTDLSIDAFIDSSIENIELSEPIIHTDGTYAGIDNCYYYETNASYSEGRVKKETSITVILVKRNNSIYPIVLVSQNDTDKATMLSMIDTIQWK